MENLMREEVVETTVDAMEEAVESVATSGSNYGKAAIIVIGAACVGFGIYKLRKFIKNKKSEQVVENSCPADTNDCESCDDDCENN